MPRSSRHCFYELEALLVFARPGLRNRAPRTYVVDDQDQLVIVVGIVE